VAKRNAAARINSEEIRASFMAASGPCVEFGGSSLRQFWNLDWGFAGGATHELEARYGLLEF
jgi:hypothetical protein